MKFSIVMPVYNGGKHFRLCVDSILLQNYNEFNLIILDNNSNDGTKEWLESIDNSKVVKYFSPNTLSIEENWSRIVSTPTFEFITIIGHDDLLDADYLSVMARLITEHPTASLYQTHFRYIDSDGQVIRKCRPMRPVQQPEEVVHNFLTGGMDIMGTGFMFRSVDYREIGGFKSYPNLLFADMEMWIELSRKNYLAVAGEECFSYRMHPGSTTSSSTDLIVLNAFAKFVNYLERIKNENPRIANTIKKDAVPFLRQYGQGITHKVLRTAKHKRQTPSVNEIVNLFREFGKKLEVNKNFEPLDSNKLRLAKIIDENIILHNLFLLFKKIYRKPVF